MAVSAPIPESAGEGVGAILTPDRRVRVFVSSTLDLTGERAAARRAIETLGLTPVMFEAGARPHPPRELYRAYVDQSDVFVAVYAGRYGWIAPGMDRSGLEDEFDLSHGKPRLVYVRSHVERDPRLEALLARVRNAGLSYRSFASPTELGSLLHDDLAVLLTERFHAAAAPPAVQPRRRAPVPVPRTALVGREAAVAAVRDQLQRGEVRLVTLVGPGGVGKTRLAIECALRAREEFPDGVFFVPLATLRQPELVADTIAAALDVRAADATPPVRSVADAIGDRRVLLVLDNFEQVLSSSSGVVGRPVAGGVTAVGELLEACEHLKVLVTSRSPLRLRGERELPVEPLALSPDRDLDGAERSPAVRLFVEAARAVRPSFELDDRSAAAVVAICRELDGLPLAIELAAAMVRIFPPEGILDRLRERPDAVGAGARDLPPRHRTLHDTIAWSYGLLDEPTGALFGQLSVFRGGFTLESAEAVCPGADVFAAVAALAEQSLLRTDLDPAGGPRFTMLNTIRRFAAARLAENSTAREVEARHARFFAGLAGAVGEPDGRARTRLDLVERELDNIRRAFEWLLGQDQPDPVAEALWASWWFWWTRGRLHEARLWADRCAAATAVSRAGRARARAATAMFAIWSGEYELAVAAFREASAVARELGDRHIIGYADIGLGLVTALTRSVAEGDPLLRRGIATLEEDGDHAGAMTGLAALSWAQGITREFDDTDEVIRDALGRARAAGAALELGIAEGALAQFQVSRGEGHDVAALLEASLEHLAGARHLAATILTLEVIAELAIDAEAFEGAATVLGATAAIRDSMGTRVPPQAAARLEQHVARLRGARQDGFAGAFASGAATGFAEAVELGRALVAEVAARTRET